MNPRMYGKGCRGRRKTRSRSRKSRRPFLGGKVAPFLWLQLLSSTGRARRLGNDQRRWSDFYFNDWINDWIFGSVGFNDWTNVWRLGGRTRVSEARVTEAIDWGTRLGCERLETRTLGMTQYLMLRHNVFGALPISTSRK